MCECNRTIVHHSDCEEDMNVINNSFSLVVALINVLFLH